MTMRLAYLADATVGDTIQLPNGEIVTIATFVRINELPRPYIQWSAESDIEGDFRRNGISFPIELAV